MPQKKSEPGRVAPAFPGRHGPAPMKNAALLNRQSTNDRGLVKDWLLGKI
jgi:hypothetical protein